MQTLVQVLKDGFFSFKEIREHTTKRLRTSEIKEVPSTVKVQFKDFNVSIRSAFTSEILVFTLTFHTSSRVSLSDAKSLASTISGLPSTVDIPKLHLQTADVDEPSSNKPDRIEWMCTGYEYKLAVLFLILSNFPNNVFDNEIL